MSMKKQRRRTGAAKPKGLVIAAFGEVMGVARFVEDSTSLSNDDPVAFLDFHAVIVKDVWT